MAKLASTQVEQLQSIGAYLRQVRQEQGLSIDTLANQIFIRPALLQALESGQEAALPEPIFIQGFIRRYAEALGLDGQTISKEFRVTPVDVLPTPELIEQADVAHTNGAAPQPEIPVDTTLAEKAPPMAVERSSKSFSLPLLLILGALAAALGLGAWGLFGRSSVTSQPGGLGTESAIDAPAPIVDEPVVDAETDETETTPAEDSTEEEDGTKAPQEAPVVVSANLSDRAWLSVVVDGKTVYEGTAESGFEETWTAQTSVVFRTGNAGGVELAVNGDRAVVMGGSGVVKTLTLTPESDLETVQTP